MSIFLDKRLILDRIKELYQLKNNAKLASFLGIPPTTLSSWYSRNTLDLDIIYEKCVEIDWQWLLTGKGSMLRDNKRSEEDKWSSTPVATPISHAEESIIYKMYEKKDEENKALIEELGGLKERIRTLESKIKEYENSEMFKERTADLTDAKDVSTKKPSSRHGSNAGSHGVL